MKTDIELLHYALETGSRESIEQTFREVKTLLSGNFDTSTPIGAAAHKSPEAQAARYFARTDEGQWLLTALAKARSLYEQGNLSGALAVAEKMLERAPG